VSYAAGPSLQDGLPPVDAGPMARSEKIFGPSGGFFGCWCMYWRASRSDFENPTRRKTMKSRFRKRVAAGPSPGLLAYRGGEPVGWIQIGPRSDVPNWNGARRLSAPVDPDDAADEAVYAVSCFVVPRGHRGQGVSSALVEGAIVWAKKCGARVIDACPIDAAAKAPPVSL